MASANKIQRTPDGSAGAPELGPYDRIFVATPKSNRQSPVDRPTRGWGQLLAIEQGENETLILTRHEVNEPGAALRKELAMVDFSRDTGLTLLDMGMTAPLMKSYRRLLQNPSGLVLVVGPTGSGKSTTLYAGLSELARDGRRKVLTIEGPIEYSIDGIQQTFTRSDIEFNLADGMRSFVRLDPDVILVGEIRDTETAVEAIRASQIGHVGVVHPARQ